MADPSPFAARITALIDQFGPIPLSQYMAEANAHYYATRDPLGAAGDFTTAPEISQMFGELVGLWLADRWQRAGAPEQVALVELGPGRGTLMADIRRTMRSLPALAAAGVHFVETSPVLRAAQARLHPDACWHDGLETLPTEGVLLVVANEFFDALPIRQMVRTGAGWREMQVGIAGGRLAAGPGPEPADALVPPALRDAEAGSIFEYSPMSTAIMADLATRLNAQGGAALIIDYGHWGPMIGDTFQAMRGHRFADAFDLPGEVDLTAHVDFAALAAAARAAGTGIDGPWKQGPFLQALGIDQRAAALGRSNLDARAGLARDVERLTGTDQMGQLFKVLALVSRQFAPGDGRPD